MQNGKLVVLLAVLPAVFFSTAAATCVCPERCDCNLQEGTIDCVGRGLQAIPAAINCSWSGITKINLKQNQIQRIPARAFSQVLQLEKLYLYENHIEAIDADAFYNLTALEYLYLDNNRLRNLPDNVFYPLPKLQRLLIYSNDISQLPISGFSRLRKLTRLVSMYSGILLDTTPEMALNNNSFTILDARSFNGLTSLEELYLSDNQITGLSNSPFALLNNLRKLYLNNNNLTRLTQYDFVGAYRLVTLDLNNNEISDVGDRTFLLHTSIEELFLSNNQISRITRLTVAGILNLRKLWISGNGITHISEGAFFRNRQLTELSMARNNLDHLSENLFAGLQSLITVYADSNRITYLLDSTFKHCPKLRILVLRYNLISCIEEDAFVGIPNLLYLDLGSNLLTFLPENVFQSLPNLLYLLLNFNRLTEIHNKPFRNLNRAIQLSLQHNGLVYMAEDAIEEMNSLFYLQWNIDTNFSSIIENRLVCDCSSRWLYRYTQSRRISTSILCHSPPSLHGRSITSLEAEDFECESLTAESLQVQAGPSCDNHVVIRGGCLHLTCTSTPTGYIAWSRVDRKPITPTPHSCRTFSSCVGDGREGEVVIDLVSEEHTGTYICTSSLMNVTAAVACKVTLGEPPTVLSRPDAQFLAHPGDVAYFHVQISGQPHPSVTWYQDMVNGTSKELKEGKRHVISTSGSLVVMDTKLEDQGTYRAVISNGAGTVTVESSLEFFFATACRQECQNGGTCYQVHYCYCQPNFFGRFCETYNGPPIPPPTVDDGGGSTPDYISGLGSVSGSISGFGSGDNYDGANFVDDEDFVNRHKRGTSAQQTQWYDAAADSPIDFDSSPPMSPWDLAGGRFQSLLWQVGAEERRFDNRLREARESRDRKKQLHVEQNETVKQDGKMHEAEYDAQRKESGKSGRIVPIGETEDEWIEEGEFVYVPEDKVDGTHSEMGEVEWNENLKKILLESGLGIEWNKDTGLDEGMGDGEYRDHEDAPIIMGLKLLPIDTLEIKAVDLTDIHSD